MNNGEMATEDVMARWCAQLVTMKKTNIDQVRFQPCHHITRRIITVHSPGQITAFEGFLPKLIAKILTVIWDLLRKRAIGTF